MSWRRSVLGDHIDILSGFAFKSQRFNTNGRGLPLVRIRDVVPGKSDTFYDGPYGEQYFVLDGDLLIGMDGEFNRARWRGGLSLLNQRVCRVRPSNGSLDEGYLYHALPQILKKIEDKTPFVTVKHLSANDLKQTEIPFPPLEEQKRIAAILDKADGIRRKRESALTMADELLTAIFEEFAVRFRQETLEVTLSELAERGRNTFCNGPFGSNLLTSELVSEGVPVVYIRDIRSGRYERVSAACVSHEKAKELQSCEVRPGDILVAKVGDPPGKAAIYPDDEPNAIVTQDVIRIRLDREKAVPFYIQSLLNSRYGVHTIATIIVEATRARFSLGQFKKLKFNILPSKRQKEFSEIATFVAALRDRKLKPAAIEATLMFESLAQRAFVGEL